jgi:hypothetical protein
LNFSAFSDDGFAADFAPTRPSELEADAADCTRLMCASQWFPLDSAVSALLAGRKSFLQRHERTGLRTGLLFASGWLVRWYEGTDAAVEEELERLQSDPHVHGLRLLHRSQGAGLLREGVQFATLHGGDDIEVVARRLRGVARERTQGWDAEPAEIWQALAAPCLLEHPGSLGFVGRRDVVAIASEDNQAYESVRVLARANRLRVAYQRFAGSELERADLGAAYVDLPLENSVVTRVHALPRRALATSVSMVGLRNVQCLLVLLGSREPRAQALLAEARELLASLPSPPAVVVAGRGSVTREEARDILGDAPMLSLEVLPAEDDPAALVWQLLQAGRQGRWSLEKLAA